ncbi:MAG TPA: hemolysin III family protein, partial [bacterium]|nr:hemolysin III family protein [bacterium]
MPSALPTPRAARTDRERRHQAIANSVTHGVGALLSVAGLVLMVLAAARQSSPLGVVCASVFGASLVLLYAASTLLHAMPEGPAKLVFEHLDLSAIFVLIAGTYTPFTLLVLRGPLGWSLFGVVWGLALAGIILAAVFPARFERVASYIYLAMGWIVVGAIYPLAHALGGPGVSLLVAGGLFYSVGVVFFLWQRWLHHHAIW